MHWHSSHRINAIESKSLVGCELLLDYQHLLCNIFIEIRNKKRTLWTSAHPTMHFLGITFLLFCFVLFLLLSIKRIKENNSKPNSADRCINWSYLRRAEQHGQAENQTMRSIKYCRYNKIGKKLIWLLFNSTALPRVNNICISARGETSVRAQI